MANYEITVNLANITHLRGYIEDEDEKIAYETAHDLDEATDLNPDTYRYVGQRLQKPYEVWCAYIDRYCQFYNTGSILSNDTQVVGARLRLSMKKISDYTGWYLYIKMGDDVNSIPRGQKSSFPLILNSGTVYAMQLVDDIVTGGTGPYGFEAYYYDLTWAVSMFPKGGYGLCGIALVSSKDQDRVKPTGSGGIVTFGTPHLLVTVVLSVTTDPATNVEPFTATLNGTLTQGTPGGGQWDCYFEWGSESPYDNTTTPVSKASGNTFYADISGLNPGTTYRFRAVAEHATLDTMYGSWRSFNSSGGGHPDEALARVSSLIHRWVPGSYTLEMVLGGLTSEYSLMVPSGKPTPTIPPTVPEIPTCPPGYMLSWSVERGYYCAPEPGFPEPGLLT